MRALHKHGNAPTFLETNSCLHWIIPYPNPNLVTEVWYSSRPLPPIVLDRYVPGTRSDHVRNGGIMCTMVVSCAQWWDHVHNGGIMCAMVGSCAQWWDHVRNGGIMCAMVGSCAQWWDHVRNGGIMCTMVGSCAQWWDHVHNGGIMCAMVVSVDKDVHAVDNC